MKKQITITEKTHKLALKQLCDELNNIIDSNKENINNIVSNGNLCSVLQDDLLYELNVKFSEDKRFCSLGLYNKCTLSIDALQLWTDNKIYLKKDDDIVCELEILDIGGLLI